MLELVARRQAAQLLFHVPKLPDLRNIDADAAESFTYVTDDAGAVPDHKADINRQIDLLFGLKFQDSGSDKTWNAAEFALAAGQFADIAEHRHGSGTAAGPWSDENIIAVTVAATRAAAFARETDCVGGTVDGGEKILSSHQRRCDKDLHLAAAAPRHRELFDRTRTDALGVTKIDPLNLFDPLAPDRSRLDLKAERDRAQQQQFGLGIAAVHVRGGIGLGVTLLLRLGERFGVGFAAFLHPRKDVVAGAVDDAEHCLRLLDGKALAQRTDYRYTAADAGFEAHLLAAFLRRGPDLLAVASQYGLVRCDDGFAVAKRA